MNDRPGIATYRYPFSKTESYLYMIMPQINLLCVSLQQQVWDLTLYVYEHVSMYKDR